jgi:hypothetical protein
MVSAYVGFAGPEDSTEDVGKEIEGYPANEPGRSVYTVEEPVKLKVKILGAKYRSGELMIRADIRG